METVLISLSCFGQMCNEADIVQSSETLNVLQTSQNLHVYSELSNEATKFTAGEYHLMVNSGLRDQTEPVVFVLLSNDVAVMLWHVLVAMSACTMPWLDDKNWKLYECFDKDFPIMTLLSPDCVVDNLRCSC